MNKIIVSTYCERDSYGSVFQSLALKKALYSIGCESAIIKVKEPEDKLSIRFPKSLGCLMIELTKIFKRKQILNRFSRTRKFMRENIDFVIYNSYDDILSNPPVADFYLAGSDQIWHPDLCNKMFFLDFVPEGKSKISYAASMGKTEIEKGAEEKFVKLLNNFDSFSVREQDVAEVVEKFIEKKAMVHIDPTFLCSKNFWGQYEKKYHLKRPYILLYPIYWADDLNIEVKELHKKSGLDIVVVCNSWSRVYGNKFLYDIGPGEFLYLLNNAEAVITSSFHGVALSTIYQKKLSIITNPRQPSRISNLVSALGLHIVPIEKLLEFDLCRYDKIEKNIKKEKENSFSYLSGVLNHNE